MSDYEDQGPPDGFDVEQCPLYQRWVTKQAQNELKQEMKQILEDDDDSLFKAERNTKRA
jgi:mevalonate pyrophosphate decarboxylase